MKVDTNALVSATDLNRNSGQLIARAADGERLVVLNQNRPVAAIVPIADLQRLESFDAAAQATPVAPGTRSESELLRDLVAQPGHTAVGQTSSGETAQLKLACNTWVVGCTGSGLSVALSAFLHGARSTELRPAHFAVATTALGPPVTYHETGRETPPIVTIATDISDRDRALSFIGAVQQQLQQRKALLQQWGLASVDEYRRTRPDEASELADLIVVVERAGGRLPAICDQLVESIICKGHDLAVYCWIFEQSASTHLRFGSARSNKFAQACALRVRTAADARSVVGSDEPTRLARAGDAWLLLPDSQGSDPRNLEIQSSLSMIHVAAPDTDDLSRFTTDPAIAWESADNEVAARES